MGFLWAPGRRSSVPLETFKAFGKTLPPNLVVYDARCILSLRFLHWVLRRNQDYFLRQRIDDNRISFVARQSLEGKKLLQELSPDLRDEKHSIMFIMNRERNVKVDKKQYAEEEWVKSDHPLLGLTTEENKRYVGKDAKFSVQLTTRAESIVWLLMVQSQLRWGFIGYCLYYAVPEVLLELVFSLLHSKRWAWFGAKHGEAQVPVRGAKPDTVRNATVLRTAKAQRIGEKRVPSPPSDPEDFLFRPTASCPYPTREFMERSWKMKAAVEGKKKVLNTFDEFI